MTVLLSFQKVARDYTAVLIDLSTCWADTNDESDGLQRRDALDVKDACFVI